MLGILSAAALAYVLGSSPGPPDADTILDKARAAWASSPYPPEIAFDTTETVTHRSVVSTSHYHAVSDVRTGSVFGSAVSDEEIAHPYTPHGMTFRVVVRGPGPPRYGLTMGAPEHTFDYIGVPRLSPVFSFGLCTGFAFITSQATDPVGDVRRSFGNAPKASPSPAGGSLRVIATVSAKTRDYEATTIGTEMVGDHIDYHLRLVPVRNPSFFRLREVWIRSDTYFIDRAITHGNFSERPFPDLDWTATFVQIEGSAYLASEETTKSFTVNGRHYDSARIDFADVQPTLISSLQRLSFFGYNPDTEPAPLVEPGR